MSQPRQIGIRARAVDNDKIIAGAQMGHGGNKLLLLGALAQGKVIIIKFFQRIMFRHRNRTTANPNFPVFDIARERALANIQIHCADAKTLIQQSCRHMHGGGGFARSALFIADHNNMRTAGGSIG